MLQTLSNAWNSFETWIYSWWPGAKTKIVAFLGFLGNGAYAIQTYFQGLPQNKFIDVTELALVNLGLFTLAYWFRGMGDRVASDAAPTA